METVTRHRGARYDEDGKLTPASTTSLAATAIAPGGGGHNVERARDGRTVQCTVYFTTFVDLVNGDELTVRGNRFQIIVNEWRSPWTGRGGLEVLCVKGQG